MTAPWIHPDAENWLRNVRKLRPDAMLECKVQSGHRAFDCCKRLPIGEPLDWLLFPNYRDGKLIGVKLRTFDKGKYFWQKNGSKHLLYTATHETLSKVETSDEALIICEGELDYFSWRDAGFDMVASAPSASAKKGPESGPPKWIEDEYDQIILARRIIIAVDCDAAGSMLKAQMIRYLDRFRLYEVEFPDGCKDGNDVLQKFGREEGLIILKDMIHSAKPVKVSGVRKASEIKRDAEIVYHRTGWHDLDRFVRLTPGLYVITGYSGAGKSQFLWQLNAYLLASGWYGAAAYLENDNKETVEEIERLLQHTHKPGHPGYRRKEAEEMIDRMMTFVDARQARGRGEKITTEWLVDLGESLVVKDGIRFLVIDTWSRVSRKTSTHRNEVEQINEELQMLQDFGQQFGVCVILCAHPTKPRVDKLYPPTEYDIAGARSFNDNADGVWILHRPSKDSDVSYFRNAKVRNQNKGGSLGWLEFQFDKKSRTLSGVPLKSEPSWKTLSDNQGESR